MKNILLLAIGLVLGGILVWAMVRGQETDLPVMLVPHAELPVAAPAPAKPQPQFTYKNASAEVIKVEVPYPGAVTGKDFTIVGQARAWYFEGSFPVQVLDKDGKTIARGIATAEGEWMTSNWVSFKAPIKVPQSYMGPATIVLEKDNPSDKRELDASVSFPITIEY